MTIFVVPQSIMKDKWMNVGYEDDELKPYLEPEPDYRDHKRIGESASMYITLTTYRVYVRCFTSFMNITHISK